MHQITYQIEHGLPPLMVRRYLSPLYTEKILLSLMGQTPCCYMALAPMRYSMASL
jgi:hypothetical protein